MDILYYSHNCKFSQKLLAHLAKNGMTDKFNFVCIDRRTRDPLTQQTYIVLDRGSKVLLPPNVHRVPNLVLINEKYRSVVGDEIYGYLEILTRNGGKNPQFSENSNGGEPAGYVLSSTYGGMNIVSETFTYYDANPEELLAKGTGSMRQMHNYVPVAVHETQRSIMTPEETYRPNKLGEEVTLDSLQQRRNDELQGSMPHASQQINQAIMPSELSNIKPPNGLSQIQTMPGYKPFFAQSRPNTENAREILFGNGSGWSGGNTEETDINAPLSSPYLANI